MASYFVISLNKNIIYINNNKAMKLFSKDLIDVSLEACQCVC